MARLRDRCEVALEGFAAFLCRRPVPAVVAVLLVAAALSSGVRNLAIDTSTESFLHPDDPVMAEYERFRERFGRDDTILVSVRPVETFGAESLRRLATLHADLEAQVPHVAQITSMVNARNTRGDGDRLVVGDLLETWPETDEARAALRERVLANPLYRNALISADGTTTVVAIELARFADTGGESIEDALAFFDGSEDAVPRPRLTDEETHQVVAAVDEVVERHRSEGFALHVAGTPAVTDALKIELMRDMRRFVLLALAVVLALLYVTFRTAAAVALPLVVVVLALLSTLGLMGHLGVAVTLPIVILPSFLLAVGVGASVHLLTIHRHGIRRGLAPRDAIVGAMGHSGLPVLLTSLTTAAGLGSFSAAEVAPIADLGRFAAAGVLIALLYTLTLVPAGLSLWPRRRSGRTASPGTLPGEGPARRLDRALERIAHWSVTNARPIAGVSLVAVAVAVGMAAQLRFSHDILAWLPERWPVHAATRAVDRDLGGSVALEVLIDTKAENGLHDRQTLMDLDRLAREIEAESAPPVPVGKASSVVDLLKEIHQALNENRPEYRRVPDNPRLIPQEFLLFENSGSDDLEDLVDAGFRTARFTLRVPWRDTLAYPPFIRDVETRFRETLGARADVATTGIMSLLSRTLEAAIRSAAVSYAVAFCVIAVMMVALIGRIGTGLISMIPNLAPIALTLALMQVAGIPLNLFTMLVGSIAIGLAVDDTLHFMHQFHRYLDRGSTVEDAVRLTMQTSGRAMLATTVVLAAGFFLFCLADMVNLVHFGLLTGCTVATALAADFVLAPALMAIRYRRHRRDRPQPTSGEPK